MTTHWNVHGQNTLCTTAESVISCQIKAMRQWTGDISFLHNVAQFCRKKNYYILCNGTEIKAAFQILLLRVLQST
jgi:hypothetical protein